MIFKKTAPAPSPPKYPGIPTAVDGTASVVEMETAASEGAGAYPITPSTQMGEGWAAAVAAGYPKFNEQSVWINRDQRFADVSKEVWDFCVGGHQVSRKWLRDRRGRELSTAEIAHYDYIVRAIHHTRDVMAEIDRVIESHGGWPAAFSAHD